MAALIRNEQIYTITSVRNAFEYCQMRLAEIERKKESFPEADLHVYKNNNYFTWEIVQPDGTRQILPKNEEAEAVVLSKKMLLTAQEHDLKILIEAFGRCLRYYDRSVKQLDELQLSANPELKRLLSMAMMPTDQRVINWANEPYDKYDQFPENLIFPTLKEGEFVRSKIEAIVAAILYRLGLQYKYEKMTLLGNKWYAVDFTVLDTRDFREIPLEVFGMMSNQEYYDSYCKKMYAYNRAGYVEGINFLAFKESSVSPLGQLNIENEIRDFFFNKPPRSL